MYDDKEGIKRYRRQLNIYPYLVEERISLKVSRMHFYYTDAKEDKIMTITYPNSRTAVEGNMEVFGDTVHKIMNKNFSHCANELEICRSCDFRFLCVQK